MNRQEFGKQGETIAIAFLKKEGYAVLETNFRKHSGEIDIIARSPENETVFIEVKTRRGNRFGYPEEAVDARKIRKIFVTAQCWLALKKMNADGVRIDVIAIEFKNGKPEITHLKNIS